MPPTDFTTAANETSIDSAVMERVADRAAISGEQLADALVVLHAELIGHHAEYEQTGEYVTGDDVRAYRVDADEWDRLADEMDLEDDVADAVRAAHTEQARLMFSADVDSRDDFPADEAGVVVGIDTAEEF